MLHHQGMWLVQLAETKVFLFNLIHRSLKKRKASTGQPADSQARAKRTAPQLQQPHPGNSTRATQKQVGVGGTTEYVFVQLA